ncbi:MAG: hypothetical protein GQ564_04125 [Bacteroidales bacterium]|nr:hypothetical protein [Bacteroidales bacterium]
MKTLKTIFVINKNKKTINSFSGKLDLNAMIMIKGGEGDPQDDNYWPPPAPAAPVTPDPILPVLNNLPS